MRKNTQVAKILYQIADLLEIQSIQWKPAAYRKAAQSVESLSRIEGLGPKTLKRLWKQLKIKNVEEIKNPTSSNTQQYHQSKMCVLPG